MAGQAFKRVSSVSYIRKFSDAQYFLSACLILLPEFLSMINKYTMRTFRSASFGDLVSFSYGRNTSFLVDKGIILFLLSFYFYLFCLCSSFVQDY